MKIVVLERNSVGTDVDISCYEKLGEVTVYPNTVAANTAERVKDADMIIANKAPLNRETLAEAEQVKLICEFATGYDNIDLEYCREKGIAVANVVDYSTAAVAQHTFALTLYLLEKLRHYDEYVKSGAYAAQERFSNFDLAYTELEGKTWGIVGMGHIGKRVAKIAEAFGCRILFYSASGNSTCTKYQRVDLETLCRESDFLSLHCPLTDRTHHLINADALRQMKPQAILINVARGGVVDTQALYQALTEGWIAGAGLDVLEQEPIAGGNPLGTIQDSSRLIITPHLAWASTEARERVVAEVYQNIQAFLAGEKRNLVNF